MNECCATCKRWIKLVMFDFSHGGYERHDMGHCCTAFADEGKITWIVGNDAEHDMCEAYEPKEG